MFIEIKHKVGKQNRISLVNTDKITSFNPCYELKYNKSSLFEHLEPDEIEKIPDNPLITDFPDRVVKIVKYNVDVDCGNLSYEISLEESDRIKNILLEVK